MVNKKALKTTLLVLSGVLAFELYRGAYGTFTVSDYFTALLANPYGLLYYIVGGIIVYRWADR